VAHAPQSLIRIQDQLMAPPALDVGHESDTTTVPLVRRIVESLFSRKPAGTLYRHLLDTPLIALTSAARSFSRAAAGNRFRLVVDVADLRNRLTYILPIPSCASGLPASVEQAPSS
jgi:hypothetical protein